MIEPALLMKVSRLLSLVCAVFLASGCQDDAAARIQKAKNAVFAKTPDRALKEYRLALDLIERDDSPEARVLHARALKGAADVYYLELQDFARAAEVYQELLRTCPEAPESLQARIQLADILHAHFRDLRGAINALTGAIDRNAPESAELIYRVAKLYFELGDYEQSTVETDRVSERFETSAFVDDALLLKSQALSMMEGRQGDAMRTLTRLIDEHPDSSLVPHALYEKGKLRAEAGEREEAIELWVKALSDHPSPELVQSSIARVRRQIIERTPSGIGDRTMALRRAPDVVPVKHRTSLEAIGAGPDDNAGD